MKRFFKRVTSIMAAVMMLFNSLPTGALAAQGSFGATTNLRGATAANQPTNDYNFKSILGNGVYFGITANKLEQQNHLQTNFAVNSYTNQNDAGTKPNLSGNSAGMFYIGSVDGNRMVPENDSGEFFIFTSSGEDKFLKHGSCDVEISDNAVLEGAHSNYRAGSSSDDLLGFHTHVTGLVGSCIDGYDRGLANDYALSAEVHKCIRSTEVNADIFSKHFEAP